MAQQPVPGIIILGSMPEAPNRSSRSMRSSTDSELASLLVPNTASPTFWLTSHLQWRIQRSASGLRSFLNGVTTGDSTPVIRAGWVMAAGSLSDIRFVGRNGILVNPFPFFRALLPLPTGERVGVRGRRDGFRSSAPLRPPPHPALSPEGRGRGPHAHLSSAHFATALSSKPKPRPGASGSL